MKQFTSESQKIGQIGENSACKFLLKQGYRLLERNYTKKYGEIDIIAARSNMLHFVEVKTVSCEISENNVIHETIIRPEDNMHPAKLRKLLTTIQAYLLERAVGDDMPWQLDLASVHLDLVNKKVRVEMIENIIA